MGENHIFNEIAMALRDDVSKSMSGSKRLKMRTLLTKFGISKRSDRNTADITEALSNEGLSINPPIVRFSDKWLIAPDDWIYLSCVAEIEIPLPTSLPTWNADGWFDKIADLDLRTEKEVETKFIIPLLSRLGYDESDRFDGMPIKAAHGSKDTTLVIDFALFNNTSAALRNQPLLTLEAKREGRLQKKHELASAHNQAKSYCLWTQCDFFMVTDSRTIQAFHIGHGRLGELNPIFACERNELRDLFSDLYAIVSKDALTRYYLNKLSTTDEAR